MDRIGIDLRVSADTHTRFRSILGQFRRFDARARLETEYRLHDVGGQLQDALKEEFAPHNRTGATMRTLQVSQNGMDVDVTMGGGAPYVEYGFPPHMISGHPLHWTGGKYGGGDHYAMSVQHPGYQGDPFVERAMERMQVDEALNRIALGAFSVFDEGAERHRMAAGAARELFEQTGDMIGAQARFNEALYSTP